MFEKSRTNVLEDMRVFADRSSDLITHLTLIFVMSLGMWGTVVLSFEGLVDQAAGLLSCD